MAKLTSKAAEPNGVNADSTRLARALDSLGLVDSELDEIEWMRRVTERVGDDVEDWLSSALNTGELGTVEFLQYIAE